MSGCEASDFLWLFFLGLAIGAITAIVLCVLWFDRK
jgi:hypothetical protein